ncbi:MAG: methyltransferase, partial [Anaerolineae bacterium]|nr:methyltransferase [Anaerolineae bacterium]
METVTNWIQLWRDLVEARYQHGAPQIEDEVVNDRWQERARRYHRKVELRWQKPDIIREFLIDHLKETPDATLLDIGAGTGAWACVLAPYVRTLTALDPSASMLGVLKEN